MAMMIVCVMLLLLLMPLFVLPMPTVTVTGGGAGDHLWRCCARCARPLQPTKGMAKANRTHAR